MGPPRGRHRRTGRARPGGRAAARACPANGPSTASWRATATGDRRSSPSIPRSSIEPLRSVRDPWNRRRYLLANTHPGSVAVARLTVAGIEPITLVSVYGVMDGSSVSTMLRIMADLVPLFDSPDGARVILGGDFNVSRAGKDARYLARSEAVLGAIRSLGPGGGEDDRGGATGTVGRLLVRVRRGPATTSATWGRTELDHLFLSPALAPQVTALTVDPACRRGGTVGPRAARARPRAHGGAHAPRLGRGVVRRGDRPPPRPRGPRRRREARVLGGPEGTRARRQPRASPPRCSPASRPTASPPSPS